MSGRGGRSRLASWAYVASVFALAGVGAAALLDGRGTEAALAAGAIAAVLIRPLAGLLVAAVAALFGAWLIAALALLTALTVQARKVAARIPPRLRPPPREALASVLDEAPAELIYAARVQAGPAPLSTWHLVSLARLPDRSRWAGLLGKDPGEEAWDGPVLELGERRTATMFFAESFGLGLELARRQKRTLDQDLLAIAAIAIPLAAAGEWNTDLERSTDRVLGIAVVELVEALAAFSKTEAGRDIMRRAELVQWGEARMMEREFVFELGATRLPRLATGFFT